MISLDVFNPLESKRTLEVISEQIKDLVNSRELKLGDKLPSKRELATPFKSGRIGVCGSLGMLEQSGLISARNGHTDGIFVRDVGADARSDSMTNMAKLGKIGLHQLAETRLEIESAVIGLAVKHIDAIGSTGDKRSLTITRSR